MITGPPQAPKNADFTWKFYFENVFKPFLAPAALPTSLFTQEIFIFLSKSLFTQEIIQNLLFTQDRWPTPPPRGGFDTGIYPKVGKSLENAQNTLFFAPAALFLAYYHNRVYFYWRKQLLTILCVFKWKNAYDKNLCILHSPEFHKVYISVVFSKFTEHVVYQVQILLW